MVWKMAIRPKVPAAHRFPIYDVGAVPETLHRTCDLIYHDPRVTTRETNREQLYKICAPQDITGTDSQAKTYSWDGNNSSAYI